MSYPSDLSVSPEAATYALFDIGHNDEDVALVSYEISAIPGHDYQFICLWDGHLGQGSTFYGDSRFYLKDRVTGLLHVPSQTFIAWLQGHYSDPEDAELYDPYLPDDPAEWISDQDPIAPQGHWVRVGPNWAYATDAA